MEIDRSISTIPIYFDDLPGGLPFMPFLVVPLQNSQDTLLFGPQRIADSHDRFIDQIYREISHDKKTVLSIRCFLFEGMISIAVLLPTGLKDEGGREGLTVSIGLFLNAKAFRLRSTATSAYFKTYLNLLNRTFALTLPHDGADGFLKMIRSAYSDNELTHQSALGIKITTLLDSLILASASAGEMMSSRWKWSRRRWNLKRKLPKIIIYESDTDYLELLSFFFAELDGAITRKGKTGIQQPFDDLNGMTCISLVPLEGCLRSASAIKLRKRHRRRYLNIY